MKTKHRSTIGPVIRRYVTLKRSLGFNFIKQANILLSLDQFLTDRRNSFRDLTAEAFFEWCKGFTKLSSGELQRRMQVVRSFCLYRRRSESDCFVPDKSTFPACHQPLRPYIFSVSEIGRLLDQSNHLTRHPHSPLRPELFRLIVVLLFTTGLRHGELLRLTVADYDPTDGTLFIRESKFHKSRLLPLRDDVRGEVERYLEVRRRWHLPVTPETPLVWNRAKLERAYSHCGVWLNVRLLLKMANIQKPDGRLPRVHDFRHSFAVNALLRWYRSGVDVQSKLPYLSAYMGHVNIESTYYYWHFVEPLTSLASSRFANHYGALVSPAAKRKGGSR
ncbi:MAG TPA: tyrosine-type recombinase/integrase [Pyrinomonadaceae bacterium]